jgi:hypothetical protein
MDFFTALGPPEFRPGKERQAEADGRGVEGQQLVLKPKLLLAVTHEVRGAEMIRQLPEQLLEKLRRTVVVDEQPKRPTRLEKHLVGRLLIA